MKTKQFWLVRINHGIVILPVILFLLGFTVLAQDRYQTNEYKIQVSEIYSGLRYPWGFDFLPDGTLLITEKNGNLLHLNLKTQKIVKVDHVPSVKFQSQGGLLDILVDPDFTKNSYIYLTYSEHRGNQSGTTAARFVFKDNSLKNILVLFRGMPATSTVHHYGSRIRITPDKYIFISHGDRGNSKNAQKLDNHFGKLIRLNFDGSTPNNNPYVSKSGVLPEIFTLGHRNPQGMTIHPKTGDIWISEHGAKGGDEINIIRSGKNYGWPIVSYGVHYNGTKIGIGTHRDGIEQPLFYWDPSIAPSGMTFYFGKQFPKWKSNLFVSSLKFGLISRLTVNGTKVREAERIFSGQYGRIRDIKESPSGSLMFVTDQNPGKLYEITVRN